MWGDTFYNKVLQNAEHYRALGVAEVYIHDAEGALPWQHVSRCEPGGTHRMEIATSVWFYADDPACPGITFRWTFDIEPSEANGRGDYRIDAEACRRIIRRLSGEARAKFRAYLADCAAKVKAKGDEWMQCAMRQQRDAAILQDLVNYGMCAEQPTTAPCRKGRRPHAEKRTSA